MFSKISSTLRSSLFSAQLKFHQAGRHLVEEVKNPSYKLNSLVGMVVFGVGDLVAQGFEQKQTVYSTSNLNSLSPPSSLSPISVEYHSQSLSNSEIHANHSQINATSISSSVLMNPLVSLPFSSTFFESYTRVLQLDHALSMKISLLGIFINGVCMTKWYNFLDKRVGTDQRNLRQIFRKIVLDQIFFAPMALFVFFSYNTLIIDFYHEISSKFSTWFSTFLASPRSPVSSSSSSSEHTDVQPGSQTPLIARLSSAVAENLELNFLSSYTIDCVVWPFFNFITFTHVPLVFRPIFTASVQLCWQIFLSYVVYAEENTNNKIL